MVVILNFCLKVYYFIVISGRCGPHVGGHLFNPPTHRHKRGCLRTPTVLRPKFSKNFHPFHKAPPSLFHSCPFKKFSKNFHPFHKAPLSFSFMPFQKIFQKIFHIFSRRLIVFFYIYILFPIFI